MPQSGSQKTAGLAALDIPAAEARTGRRGACP